VVPSGSTKVTTGWAEFGTTPFKGESDRNKIVVAPDEYHEVKVPSGRTFFLENKLSNQEQLE